MSSNEKDRATLQKMLKNVPEVLTPRAASQVFPVGRNNIYKAIHTGEIRSFTYRGGYVISKTDLIEYILEHCSNPNPRLVVRMRKKGSDK